MEHCPGSRRRSWDECQPGRSGVRPDGANVYTTDQDNGGIFGFTLSTGGGVTPLPDRRSPREHCRATDGHGFQFRGRPFVRRDTRAGGVHVLPHTTAVNCSDRGCGQQRRIPGGRIVRVPSELSG